VLREVAGSAEITPNHPKGIKGAQATALAVWLCRNGMHKEERRVAIERSLGYDLQRTVDGMRPGYTFDPSCQGTVPEAIIAFLDCTSWEDAARNAVSLGGDSDTLACITGAIAEAFDGPVPEPVVRRVQALLMPEPRDIIRRFYIRYMGSPQSRTPR
jgi:ADP-ribosylglycohydrolase